MTDTGGSGKSWLKYGCFGCLGILGLGVLIVATVGCLRGLQTRTGAGAVGESATSSVVSGIVLIAVADGIFAVLFYIVGI